MNFVNPSIEFKLNASVINKLSFKLKFLWIIIINKAINETTPSPPIWISINITTCPNVVHVENVGTVTSPVTQVDVVAVNNASIYDISVVLWLIGRYNNILPIKIVIKKLSNIICVVDSDIFLFIIYTSKIKKSAKKVFNFFDRLHQYHFIIIKFICQF